MSPRVFEPIRRIRVRLVTSLDRTHVRLLARVRSNVNLKILGTRKALEALWALVRLLLGVRSNVDQHFVAGVESAIRSWTSFPFAVVVHAAHRCGSMGLGNVAGEV